MYSLLLFVSQYKNERECVQKENKVTAVGVYSHPGEREPGTKDAYFKVLFISSV